ncbi:MAG: toprim domain-containing protein [Synergistaceae bacterium]|nr:toprim domain-containing protein [Synergistaceae bacterium]
MYDNKINAIISEVKANQSCFNFLTQTLNINVPHVGAAICSPDFIRPDDSHPSFGVYHECCIDFSGKSQKHSYDIIDLAALALFNGSFAKALEYLAGKKIWGQPSAVDTQRQRALDTFSTSINQWHNNLLNNPDALNYFHSRNISDNTINKFMLGYAPYKHAFIFPHWHNGHFIYYTGRDDSPISRIGLPPRNSLPQDDPDFAPKYKGAKLDRSPIYDRIPFGGQSIRPLSKTTHTYKGQDGQDYDALIDDPKDYTLCVCEGLVDALSLLQEGWQTQATGGGSFSREKLPAFLNLAKNYRQVFICFDNDNAGQKFQRAMSKILLDARINFICGKIPETISVDGEEIPIKDISDYYTHGGDINALVRNATPGIVSMAQDCSNVFELADLFMKAARSYSTTDLYAFKKMCSSLLGKKDPITGLAKTKFLPSDLNVIYQQAIKPIPEETVANIVCKEHDIVYDISGVFYEYANGIWRNVSEVIIGKYIGLVLKGKASSARMASITKYIKMMKADSFAFNTKNVIVFPNGTLHLDEEDLEKRFTPHSKADMSTIMMHYSYDPFAQCPKWRKFITEICGGDTEKMRLMQQAAGYVMFSDNRLHKFFYLLGDGSNGKSVFANVLEQVYGSENTSNISPSRMSSPFDAIVLKNSLLNFAHEAQGTLTGSEEIIKAVSSGDPIMAAYKGVDAVKFNTRAKLFMLSNRLMTSRDTSYGLLRRILFIKFDQQFIGSKANKNLYSELLEELPGIFNWCYQGYLDLKKTGEFQELESQTAIINELLDTMSPVSAFVSEVLMSPQERMRHLSGTVSERIVYKRYQQWCEEGNFYQLNRLEFMKDLGLVLRRKGSKVTGITVRKAKNENIKEFVFSPLQEDASMGQEGEEDRPSGRASTVIALGGGEGAAQGKTAEAQRNNEAETETQEGDEITPEGTGTVNVAAVDAGEDDLADETDKDSALADRAAQEVRASDETDKDKQIADTETAGQAGANITSSEDLHAPASPACNKSPLTLYMGGEKSEITADGWRYLRQHYTKDCPSQKPEKFDLDYIRYMMLLGEWILPTGELELTLNVYRTNYANWTGLKDNLSLSEWEGLREYFTAAKNAPRNFRRDYVYFTKLLRTPKDYGYGVSQSEAQKLALNLFFDERKGWELDREYTSPEGHRDFTPEEWETLSMFYAGTPELRPSYFMSEYRQPSARNEQETE